MYCNSTLLLGFQEEEKKGVTDDVPFTTKNDDLAGFWDMVMIQVDQIHEMFGESGSVSHKSNFSNLKTEIRRGFAAFYAYQIKLF